jgi:hypothetical protein
MATLTDTMPRDVNLYISPTVQLTFDVSGLLHLTSDRGSALRHAQNNQSVPRHQLPGNPERHP